MLDGYFIGGLKYGMISGSKLQTAVPGAAALAGGA